MTHGNQFTLSILPDGSLAGIVPGVSGGATWCAILAPGGPTGVQRHFLERGAPGSICHADDVLRPYAPVQFGRKGASSCFAVVMRRTGDELDLTSFPSPASAILEAKNLGWTFDVEPTPWKGRKRRGFKRWDVTPPEVPPPAEPECDPVVRTLILEAREAVRALVLSGAGADAESLEAAVKVAAARFKVL